MQSGPRRMVAVLLHWLTPMIIFFLVALVPAGCGGGYDLPEEQDSIPGSDDDPEPEPPIDLEGQWKLLALSSDSASTDLEAAGLDVVLAVAADGTARWHVKEDGQNYFYCSADDMVLTRDQQASDRVNLSYYFVLIDSQTGQVTRNDGLQQTHFSAVMQDGALIELADGNPPQGVVMLPEFDAYNEQELIRLTVTAADVDLSGSAPTLDSASLCDIKFDTVHPPDNQAPTITRFELSSATLTTDPAITFDLEGQDNVAVNAWLINESDALPAVDDAAWSDATPQGYTVSDGYRMKTVYAWAKDVRGNISDPASISVEYKRPCVYVETDVSAKSAQFHNRPGVDGKLSDLFSDDDQFLSMDLRRFAESMALTVDFELDPTDVRDLNVSVSSISASGVFQRTVSARNYVAEEWTPLETSIDVSEKVEVRSDLSLAGRVESLSDYLEPAGDKLNFRVRIDLTRVDGSDIHHIDLVQLTVTHPEDPDCVDE